MRHPLETGDYFPVGDELSQRLKDQIKKDTDRLDFVGKWLFFKNARSIGINKQIPPELIWDKMKLYALPIYSEYVEETENVDFLAISAKFFEYLFWNTELYVSYETAENSFSIVEEPRTRNPGKISLWFPSSDVENLDKEEMDRFVNMITGEVVAVDDWTEHFVKVSWNGYDEDRFNRFYRFAFMECCYNTAINEAIETTLKRINLVTVGESREYIEGFKTNLSDLSTILDLTNTSINIEPSVYMGAEELRSFVMTLNYVKDRELYELGRVANTNPKGDRMTTGENYKDIIAIANRQRAVQNQLKLFSLRFAELFGVELDFRINGIPQRQGMPEDDEQSPLMARDADSKNDKTPYY